VDTDDDEAPDGSAVIGTDAGDLSQSGVAAEASLIASDSDARSSEVEPASAEEDVSVTCLRCRYSFTKRA